MTGTPPADLVALGAVATGLVVLATVGYLWLTSRRERGLVLPYDRLKRLRATPAVAPVVSSHSPSAAAPAAAPATTRPKGPSLPALIRSIRRGQRCRWRRDAIRPETRLVRWVCLECGVDSYALQGRIPRECKRALRNPSL